MGLHHHVVTLLIGSIEIGKRGVVSVGKQDFPWKKLVVDRLQQTVLDGVQGKSLVPILEEIPGKVPEMEQVAITQHTRTSTGKSPADYMGYSIRTDKYSYTEWISKDTTQKPELEFYDFEKYLTETVNVAYTEEYKYLKKQLSIKLHEVLWRIKKR